MWLNGCSRFLVKFAIKNCFDTLGFFQAPTTVSFRLAQVVIYPFFSYLVLFSIYFMIKVIAVCLIQLVFVQCFLKEQLRLCGQICILSFPAGLNLIRRSKFLLESCFEAKKVFSPVYHLRS